MDEKFFWASLEYRVCHECSGLPTRRYRRFWCDGFIPSQYLLDDARPQITGRAWICDGPVQYEWDFALLLPRPFASRKEIDWASLLPPEDVTRWMVLDEGRKYIKMEPAVAVPDLTEPGVPTGRGLN